MSPGELDGWTQACARLPSGRSLGRGAFSHQRAVLEHSLDEDPRGKDPVHGAEPEGASLRAKGSGSGLACPARGIRSPLIFANVTSHQTEGGEWEKRNCITNLILTPDKP